MFKEDERIELKKSTSELNDAMISISAILNKHGKGTLYFGIKNNGTPHKFTINDSTLRDVSRKIFESIKPQIFPEVFVDILDGVEIIKVVFEGQEKPYSAFGKYYIRVADEDRELSPAELRNIMIAKEYEENWEDKISKETIDDIDKKTIEHFCEKAISSKRLPDMGYDTETLLKKLGVLKDGKITNAGRMLFSKNKPIALKMAVFATEHKDTFLDISKEEGNIFELISIAMNYIAKNIRWSSQIGKDGIHRVETPEVPIDALREAIINCFVHARYDSQVQHEIDIYSNRIEITNPGSFANDFSPEDFANRDIHSFLRNELIAKTLYLCKDVETFGSGIRKIYNLCKANDVKIDYTNTETDFAISFSRWDRNIVPPSGTINGTIKPDEKEVVDLLSRDSKLTIDRLSEISGKSVRTINRIMKSLREKKIIERIGSNKTGSWKIL